MRKISVMPVLEQNQPSRHAGTYSLLDDGFKLFIFLREKNRKCLQPVQVAIEPLLPSMKIISYNDKGDIHEDPDGSHIS